MNLNQFFQPIISFIALIDQLINQSIINYYPYLFAGFDLTNNLTNVCVVTIQMYAAYLTMLPCVLESLISVTMFPMSGSAGGPGGRCLETLCFHSNRIVVRNITKRASQARGLVSTNIARRRQVLTVHCQK